MFGRLWIVTGSFLAFLAVLAGAFGAHLLKNRWGADDLAIFEVAARYQMYHALALVLVGVLAAREPCRLLGASGTLFLVGVVVFSGSLYALVLTGWRGLGALTPVGGVAFLSGWVLLGLAGTRARGQSPRASSSDVQAQ